MTTGARAALLAMLLRAALLLQPMGALAGYTPVDPAQIQDILSRMTLREKLETTGITTLAETDLFDLKYNPLDIVRTLPSPHAESWFDLKDHERLGLRGMRTRDGPRGVTCLLGGNMPFGAPCPKDGSTPSFPHGNLRAASWDTSLEEEFGVATGEIAKILDVHAALLPCINILPWLNGGRSQESYGEDPLLNGKMGAATVRGVQSKGVMATPKHFLANNIENTRWMVSAEMDDKTLHEVYLKKWAIVVAEGSPEFIMTSYNRVQGNWSNIDPKFIRLLREKLGFQGSVMTDWLAIMTFGPKMVRGTPFMGRSDFFGDVNTALIAGVDMEMPFNSRHIQAVRHLAACSDADAQTCTTANMLDRAVAHLLRSKIRYGLVNAPKPSKKLATYDTYKYDALSLKIAQRGMVLLRNEGDFLPKRPADVKSVAVLGTAWFLELGDFGSSAQKPAGRYISVLEGLNETYGSSKVSWVRFDSMGLSEVERAVRSADLVVVDVGLNHTNEGEFIPPGSGGDRPDLNLPAHLQNLVLICASWSSNVVVVLTSGANIVVEEFVDKVKVRFQLDDMAAKVDGGRSSARYPTRSSTGSLARSVTTPLTSLGSFVLRGHASDSSLLGPTSSVKKWQKAGVATLVIAQVAWIIVWCKGAVRTSLFIKGFAASFSMVVAAIAIPRPRKYLPPHCVRYGLAFLITFVAVAVVTFPWNPVFPLCEGCVASWEVYLTERTGPKGYEKGPTLEYAINVMALGVLTPVTVMCIAAWKHASSYASQAIRVLILVWFSSIIWACQNYSMFCRSKMVTLFLTFLGLTFDPVHWCATMVLFLRRYEQVMTRPNHRPLLITLVLAASTTENIVSVSPMLAKSDGRGAIEGGLSVFGTVLLLMFAVVCAWPLTRELFSQHRVLVSEAKSLQGVPKVEALWAAKMISSELWAIAAALLSTVAMRGIMIVLLAIKIKRVTYEYYFMCIVFYRLYNILHGYSLVVLSGLLMKNQPIHKPELPSRSETSLASRLGADEEVWNSKVRDLANRGFELGRLLTFVEDLLGGHTMPSFDPATSTTNDVVRQAIIPLSRGVGDGEGKALAIIWSEGRPVLAKRMVTHNWSNKFLHLVGAIVADSLRLGHFEAVVAQLMTTEGIQQLREALQSQDALGNTYWVCAFSVNQHASICAGVGLPPPPGTAQYRQWSAKACDTVTKQPFVACNCNTPKYFNNEPALTELNKFDDMMTLLANEVEGFVHVIAVDKDFDVFMRAWCVAEMVEGGTLHVPQRVIIHSNESLEVHYMALATLDVRKCQATRAEDKEQILARIEDISAFNEYLQWLLFDVDGLFGSFLDREARLTAVGSILQRLRLQRSSRSSLASDSMDAESNGEDADSNADDSKSETFEQEIGDPLNMI